MDCWWDHEDFCSFISDVWESIKDRYIIGKLCSLKAKLKQWNKDVFGDLNSCLQAVQSQIDDLEIRSESSVLSSTDVQKLVVLRKESLDTRETRVIMGTKISS